MNRIEIWQPRYKDKTVLFAKYKVVNGLNEIIFTKAKHLEGAVYRISGKDIKSCPVCSNGKISCYEVPFDMLEKVQ